MSTLVALTHEVSAHLIQTTPLPIPMAASDGFLDWANTKNAETQSLVRALSITIAVIFVIAQAVMSRMAMARVIISGIAAGLLVWMVFNVTDIRDRVDNEVNSHPAPPPATQQLSEHPDQLLT